MERFEFAIRVEVLASRHTARKIAELFQEAVEEATQEHWQVIEKTRGMTVEVSTVRRLKEDEQP